MGLLSRSSAPDLVRCRKYGRQSGRADRSVLLEAASQIGGSPPIQVLLARVRRELRQVLEALSRARQRAMVLVARIACLRKVEHDTPQVAVERLGNAAGIATLSALLDGNVCQVVPSRGEHKGRRILLDEYAEVLFRILGMPLSLKRTSDPEGSLRSLSRAESLVLLRDKP